MPDEKICPHCGQSKPFDQFYKDKKGKFGVSFYCIQCNREHSRTYYQANKQRMLQGFGDYAKSHRTELAKYGKAYYAANKEKICAQARARMSDSERRARAKVRRKHLHQVLRKKILLELGGKCYCCGLDDLRFLTIDHINDDGQSDRKLKSGKAKNGYMILLDIQREGIPKSRYRVACYNCNCARHWAENRICPHQQ